MTGINKTVAKKTSGLMLFFLVGFLIFSCPVKATAAQFDDTYVGDDTYYLDDDSEKESDYYQENGSPNNSGNSMVREYAELSDKTIIESIETDIIVSKKGEYDVKKTVKAYYNTEEDHSLKMNILLNNLSASSEDHIRDIKVQSDREGTKFETESSNKGFDVVITDITKGAVYANYTITYTYISSGDDDSKSDIFLQDLIGFHESPTYNARFSIRMPSEYEKSELIFTNINGEKMNLISSHDNLEITGYCDTRLDNGFLSMMLSLNSNYFDIAQKTGFIPILMGLIFVICLILIVSGLLLAGISYYKFGKSTNPRIIPQKTWIPGLSPIDISVALTGSATNEQIMLYILQLANDGYLTITDKTYKHQRNRNPAKGYLIEKRKEYDGKDPFLRYFMKILFQSGDSVTPNDLANIAYEKINRLRLRLQDGKANTKSTNLWEIDHARRRLCANIGLIIPLLTSLLLSLLNLNAGLSIKMLSFLYGPAFAIGIYFMIKWVDKRIKKRNVMRGGVADIMTWIYVLSTTFIVLSISGTCNANMFSFHSGMMTASYFVEIILIYCSCDMKKRTEDGVALCGRILGLRQFLIEANDIEIKRLILKDEQYVYKMLPYAIILDVTTDGWLSVMDSCYIDNPTWYHANNDEEFRLTDFIKDWTIIVNAALEEPRK